MAVLRRVRAVSSGVAGSPWYMNWYFTTVGPSAQPCIDGVFTYLSGLSSMITSSCVWTIEGDVANIDDSTGLLVGVEAATGGSNAGAAAGSIAPPANQALLHLLTDDFVAGRQLRGRQFIPGLVVSQLTPQGNLASATQTDALNAANALRTSSSSFGPWRVFSKTHLTSAPIDTITCPSKVAVLRSRRD